MWFQDLVDGSWWHVTEILKFYVVADGATFDIKFLNLAAGVQTYATGYLTDALADVALAALVATFVV